MCKIIWSSSTLISLLRRIVYFSSLDSPPKGRSPHVRFMDSTNGNDDDQQSIDSERFQLSGSGATSAKASGPSNPVESDQTAVDNADVSRQS